MKKKFGCCVIKQQRVPSRPHADARTSRHNNPQPLKSHQIAARHRKHVARSRAPTALLRRHLFTEETPAAAHVHAAHVGLHPTTNHLTEHENEKLLIILLEMTFAALCGKQTGCRLCKFQFAVEAGVA